MARASTSGQGRPKGVPNKDTREIREMIITALQSVGGAEYLARQAEQNPNAFMSLLGRVLPLQVMGDKDRPLIVDFRWADSPVQQNVIAHDNGKVIEGTIEESEGETEVVWSNGSK